MLNDQQQAAFDAFGAFLKDDGVMFALFGAAGTGKSFLSAKMAEMMTEGPILWTAPTWKAARVASKFMSRNGIEHEIGWDRFFHEGGANVLATTAQALGMQPVIKDEQTVQNREFAMVGKGAVAEMWPRYLVIDEVSMLAWDQLKKLYGVCERMGIKVLLIGDPNQIPPVKSREIKWDRIQNQYRLTQIMRQSSDSIVPLVGERIIKGEEWRDLRGPGLRVLESTRDVALAFLDEVAVADKQEEDRVVFVAYENSLVDAMQDKACQKVYGHGMDVFEPGQIVIATKPLMQGNKTVIANQDVLRIVDTAGGGEWGDRVIVRNMAGRLVETEYMHARRLADKTEPYVVELARRQERAQRLQKEWVAAGRPPGSGLNWERKQAWQSFFYLKDSVILSYQHPFAITSHKAQGSTYKKAFVHSANLEKYGQRPLYVAVTRGSEETIAS